MALFLCVAATGTQVSHFCFACLCVVCVSCNSVRIAACADATARRRRLAATRAAITLRTWRVTEQRRQAQQVALDVAAIHARTFRQQRDAAIAARADAQLRQLDAQGQARARRSELRHDLAQLRDAGVKLAAVRAVTRIANTRYRTHDPLPEWHRRLEVGAHYATDGLFEGSAAAAQAARGMEGLKRAWRGRSRTSSSGIAAELLSRAQGGSAPAGAGDSDGVGSEAATSGVPVKPLASGERGLLTRLDDEAWWPAAAAADAQAGATARPKSRRGSVSMFLGSLKDKLKGSDSGAGSVGASSVAGSLPGTPRTDDGGTPRSGRRSSVAVFMNKMSSALGGSRSGMSPAPSPTPAPVAEEEEGGVSAQAVAAAAPAVATSRPQSMPSPSKQKPDGKRRSSVAAFMSKMVGGNRRSSAPTVVDWDGNAEARARRKSQDGGSREERKRRATTAGSVDAV